MRAKSNSLTYLLSPGLVVVAFRDSLLAPRSPLDLVPRSSVLDSEQGLSSDPWNWFLDSISQCPITREEGGYFRRERIKLPLTQEKMAASLSKAK